MTDWMEFAACRGADDPETWFPISESGFGQQIRDAKAVCQRCPVRGQCLNYGLATKSVGIWGGTTDGERKTIHRRRRRQKSEGPPPERERPVMAAKRCSRCKKTKPYAEFDRNRRNRDGLAWECKACRIEHYRRQKHGDHPIPDAKRCTKCELTKPAAAFARDRKNPTGLTPRCKECRNVDRRERAAP